MRVAVVGLGHIGLALAVQYASRGHTVVGYDIDLSVVEALNAGRAPHDDEPEVVELVPQLVSAGRLLATVDPAEALPDADVVVVIVPVAVSPEGAVDFTAIDAATDQIGRALRPGTLVIFETTLPVGTTRERLAPVLARNSGLSIDRDLFVAFSPERVLVGRVLLDLRRYPKVVGGIGPKSRDQAVRFYAAALDEGTEIRALSSVEAAEMTKLAETTYRDVNIALANEYARYAAKRGIDIGEVIDAANSQPYSHIHQPGLGVGGHCIPVYPRFLADGGPDLRLPPLAREVNDGMAAWAVDQIDGRLGSLRDVPVLVLGIAYRGDVREDAFSSAFALRDALRAAGARVFGHDPYYDAAHLAARGFEPWDAAQPSVVRVAILQAAHAEYLRLDLTTLPGVELVVDGRNALDRRVVSAAGIAYLGVGR